MQNPTQYKIRTANQQRPNELKTFAAIRQQH
jgi:hypothetical protein